MLQRSVRPQNCIPAYFLIMNGISVSMFKTQTNGHQRLLNRRTLALGQADEQL